jgi:LytS/YehU family sensor histidine kinase
MLKDIRNSNIYLGRFADLMRKTLDFSSRTTISLIEEKKMLEVYLSLEKLRFGDDFVSEIKINFDEYDAEKLQVPSMLLQPYVENAVKHGLLHKKGDKKLDILFSLKDKKLICKITDNGVGRKRTAKINARKA